MSSDCRKLLTRVKQYDTSQSCTRSFLPVHVILLVISQWERLHVNYIPDVKYANRHNWIDLPLRISGFSSAKIAVRRCVNHLHLTNFVHVLNKVHLTKYISLGGNNFTRFNLFVSGRTISNHSILAGWKISDSWNSPTEWKLWLFDGFVMNVYAVRHGTRNYFPPVIEFIYHSRKPFPRGLGVGCFWWPDECSIESSSVAPCLCFSALHAYYRPLHSTGAPFPSILWWILIHCTTCNLVQQKQW